MEVLVTPSRDRRGSEMELRSTVHVFWCIDGQDLIVISHLTSLVVMFLAFPSRESRNSEMKLYGALIFRHASS